MHETLEDLFPPGGVAASPERSSPHLTVSCPACPSTRLVKSGPLWEQFRFNPKGHDRWFMNRQNGVHTGDGPGPALPRLSVSFLISRCPDSPASLPRGQKVIHIDPVPKPLLHHLSPVEESVSAYSFRPGL